ncbi:hypothetical protein Scep_027867 [Stephania cephalantha]|uniref:Uncharacterized protein n=1 Tax=Stephania cephalantha TaxID=152367 RepID=A0AAP0HMY0_9MAGN
MFGWGSPVHGFLSFDREMFSEVVVMGSSWFSYDDSRMSIRVIHCGRPPAAAAGAPAWTAGRRRGSKAAACQQVGLVTSAHDGQQTRKRTPAPVDGQRDAEDLTPVRRNSESPAAAVRG